MNGTQEPTMNTSDEPQEFNVVLSQPVDWVRVSAYLRRLQIKYQMRGSNFPPPQIDDEEFAVDQPVIVNTRSPSPNSDK